MQSPTILRRFRTVLFTDSARSIPPARPNPVRSCAQRYAGLRRCRTARSSTVFARCRSAKASLATHQLVCSSVQRNQPGAQCSVTGCRTIRFLSKKVVSTRHSNSNVPQCYWRRAGGISWWVVHRIPTPIAMTSPTHRRPSHETRFQWSDSSAG